MHGIENRIKNWLGYLYCCRKESERTSQRELEICSGVCDPTRVDIYPVQIFQNRFLMIKRWCGSGSVYYQCLIVGM